MIARLLRDLLLAPGCLSFAMAGGVCRTRCRKLGQDMRYASAEIKGSCFEQKICCKFGNLAWSTTEEDLAQLFHPYGGIASVRIVTYKDSGRSRGFAFVEMPDNTEAQAAIARLNGTSIEGRPLTVKEAHPREGEDRLRRPRW